jgi:hypothetical protein
VQRNKELWLALLAILVITGLYAASVTRIGVPAASGFLGHSLGVLGFVLMLTTETLYSLRKRAMRRPWGTMRSWLQAHIFTGVVGPYLVFLHSAWSFRGLAGVVMLLTVVVVLSGFLGRYIYTAVPRTSDGMLVEAQALEAMLAGALHDLEATQAGGSSAPPAALRRAKSRLREVERQLDALRWARRLLATWHTVHIPLGMVLFATAFVHAAAAMYYATLLR